MKARPSRHEAYKGWAGTLANLGDTYHTRGDIEAARDTWRTTLAIFTDLDHPDAEQVRARLGDVP